MKRLPIYLAELAAVCIVAIVNLILPSALWSAIGVGVFGLLAIVRRYFADLATDALAALKRSR